MTDHIPFPETTTATADVHRRVAGNLSVPRTIDGLRQFIAETDPYVPAATNFQQVVQTLTDQGFVERLGEFSNPEDVVDAVKANENTPNMPRDYQTAYKRRLSTGRGNRFLGIAGTLYVLSQKGYDALTGPVENEPPAMEGRQLEVAEEFNRRLAEDDAKINEEGLKQTREQLQAALDELKGASK